MMLATDQDLGASACIEAIALLLAKFSNALDQKKPEVVVSLFTEAGVFRTLALGVRASRNASLARDAAARTIRAMIEEMEDEGRLAMVAKRPVRRKLRAAS